MTIAPTHAHAAKAKSWDVSPAKGTPQTQLYSADSAAPNITLMPQTHFAILACPTIRGVCAVTVLQHVYSAKWVTTLTVVWFVNLAPATV